MTEQALIVFVDDESSVRWRRPESRRVAGDRHLEHRGNCFGGSRVRSMERGAGTLDCAGGMP